MLPGPDRRQSGVIAPIVLDGTMMGPAFRAYRGGFGARPQIRRHSGDGRSRRANVGGVGEVIAVAGAGTLYLSPYSPDRSPIEQLFANLKALLRRAAARTEE